MQYLVLFLLCLLSVRPTMAEDAEAALIRQ